MLRLFKATFLATVWVIWQGQAHANPERLPALSVQLEVSLDRDSYHVREPMLLQWKVTNDGAICTRFQEVVPEAQLSFKCIDCRGKEIPLYCATTVDYRHTFTPFHPGQSRSGWLVLLEEYIGLLGPGEYRLRATLRSGGFLEKSDEAFLLKTTSKDITLRITEPKGPDAEVVRFIETAVAKERGTGNEKTKETPSSLEEQRQAAEYREYFLNVWMARRDILEDVASQAKSPRFRAAALFRQGEWGYSELASDFSTRRLEQVRRNLTACIACEGSSPYMKGLAAYYLLLCKRLEAGKDRETGTAIMAENLRANYPGTYMAQEAVRILEELRRTKR